MRPSPRAAIVCLALIAGFVGCGSNATPPTKPTPTSPAERIDRALTRAADFLAGQQSADGAWRSDFYGPLKDGPSLTPLAIRALQAASPFTATEAKSARARGLAYLAALTRADGSIDESPHGLSQPVYTAALATTALSHLEAAGERTARDAWLKYLRERQLTESLGWEPADKEYGGWGYCAVLPRKPAPGEARPPLLESNLSATAFALAALRAADVPAADPAFRAALVFVKRCQNNTDDPRHRDAAFDDGGFFFIYDDAARNKAGVAGQERAGRPRFASYGSATADGLGCLRACGVADDDPRTTAARRWLETHFDVSTHPGNYAPDRAPGRDSVYYYYCRSLAHALDGLAATELSTPAGPVRWAETLAGELLKRQREDGSWVNDALAQRENDPLIATAEALEALAVCRSALSR